MENECNVEKKECDGGYCEMSKAMHCLADKAWEALMLDKMKAVWEKERGATMDKVAQVAIAHSMAVWKARMEAKDMKKQASDEEIERYKQELANAFMG